MLGALFGKNPFRPSPARRLAQDLYAAIVAVSRRAVLYGPERAPDTLEGRFEMLTLHAVVAMERLRADAAVDAVGEPFANILFRGMDAGLREAGVGDLSVPKRMQKLAGSFYGRAKAYGEAGDDAGLLAAALARNVWGREAHPFAPALAEHLRACRSAFADQPIEAMAEEARWPIPPTGAG